MKKRRMVLLGCLICCMIAGIFEFVYSYFGIQSYHEKNGENYTNFQSDESNQGGSQLVRQNLESKKEDRLSADVENELPFLKFKKKKTKIKAGSTYTYKLEKKNIREKVTFRSSNEKVAVISKTGKLTAKEEGNTWISASVKGCSVKMKVTVMPKKVIAVDPGHSQNPSHGREPIGPGASTMKLKDSGGTYGVVTGIREYELTLKLAKKLRIVLQQRGYQVMLTRENNETSISNIERAQVANQQNSDIFVRIHADGCKVSSVYGASTIYPTSRNPYVGALSEKSFRLSECILNAMCQTAGTKNRGSFGRDDLAGSNWAAMPVTLVEVGYMTNPLEDTNLQDEDYQEKLVTGIADGIDHYFGY